VTNIACIFKVYFTTASDRVKISFQCPDRLTCRQFYNSAGFPTARTPAAMLYDSGQAGAAATAALHPAYMWGATGGGGHHQEAAAAAHHSHLHQPPVHGHPPPWSLHESGRDKWRTAIKKALCRDGIHSQNIFSEI
jgi:hypothetical protein